VTIQVSQIQAPEASLFQDSFIQNSSDQSFQHYLEEETQRLGSLFSPWNQFDFGSWFTYPDFSSKSNSNTTKVNLFSDIEVIPYENSQDNHQATSVQAETVINQLYGQPSNASLTNTPQVILQDLLAKSGWLTPNLEMHPLFYQAQLQGKLLSKLDLQFLVDQILTQVKIVKTKGKVELTLGLRPENLGEILLTLTSRSGMVTIQIQAPEETRKLIEAELAELEMALKKAKVNLADITVVATKEVGENA